MSGRANLWMRKVADRCQMLATEGPSVALIADVRQLLRDVPDEMTMVEQRLVCSVLSQVLARIVITGRMDARPEITQAFVALADASGKAHIWRQAFLHAIECAAVHEHVAVAAEPPDDRIVRAVKYIEEHGADGRLTLSEVARAVHISQWHLARLLKRQTGHGFIDHLHRTRIVAARRHLEQTALSVKEIAGAVGYSSSSQLDRRFRRHVGVTPLSYRQSIRSALRRSS
jgi:AraC-like DNA-binding protein